MFGPGTSYQASLRHPPILRPATEWLNPEFNMQYLLLIGGTDRVQETNHECVRAIV